MFTIAYKAGWIHGYCDRDECRVQFPDFSTRLVKSAHAAKLAISRFAK